MECGHKDCGKKAVTVAVDVIQATDGSWRFSHKNRYRYGCEEHPVAPLYRNSDGNPIPESKDADAQALMAQALGLCKGKGE